MGIFFYRARDKDGKLVAGEIEARNSNELKENLFHQGLIPIFVREMGAGSPTMTVLFEIFNKIFNRVKAEELMVFTRQFYTLFRAGVSMETIFDTLKKQISSKALKSAVTKIRADIAGGSSLSQAFGRHPRVFNELYVSMLSAGEEAGILEEVLKELVKLLAKEEELKKNVKSATLYPKIVITVLVLAIFVLMSVVVPRFSSFYGKYNATLPLPTLILINVSKFTRAYWYLVLGAMGGIYFAFMRYHKSRTGKLKLDQLKFQLPVFGDLTMKIANSRFGHILSALYKSGLPMPRCLEVVAKVVGNEAFSREVLRIRDNIQKGATLSEAMARESLFPPVMVETTAVGERAGSLDEMLDTIADHYDLEISHTIKNLTTLLEPLLLVGIFGMVTVLALAIFLPIWNLSQVVNK